MQPRGIIDTEYLRPPVLAAVVVTPGGDSWEQNIYNISHSFKYDKFLVSMNSLFLSFFPTLMKPTKPPPNKAVNIPVLTPWPFYDLLHLFERRKKAENTISSGFC